MATGPGLTKVRRVPLLRTRTMQLVTSVPGAMARAIEQADTMSEGGVRLEGETSVYYGSTVMILGIDESWSAKSGRATDAERAAVFASLLVRDPHLRLLAIRIAHREAVSRAVAPLGTLQADLRITSSATTVRVDVDVSARILDRRARRRA